MKTEIDIQKFSTRAFNIWDKTWLLLTCGNHETGDFNSMTVAWGSFGNMWNFPLALVVVRPTRYTYEFINKYDSFTLCAFPEEFRDQLNFLGTVSGRDREKIAESKLTPASSAIVSAPGFEEADLWIECKKMYWQDFDPKHFIIPEIESRYPNKDYHRMIFGKIVKVVADENKYAS